MVQTRWEHMNRDHSLLTSIQALMLDGHHMVENRARFGAGNMFNFSGTGGMWRRQAIQDAGGWEHDTLTEDLDLSYRAQLAGWRFVYRGDVLTPASCRRTCRPSARSNTAGAKGTVQTARKLLKRVATSELTFAQRVEACFHMLPHFAYPMTVLLTLLLLPALVFMPASDVRTLLLIDLPLCIGATGSLATFYTMAEVAQGRSAWGALKRLPALIALGAGLAPHLSSAVFDGMRSLAGRVRAHAEARRAARSLPPSGQAALDRDRPGCRVRGQCGGLRANGSLFRDAVRHAVHVWLRLRRPPSSSKSSSASARAGRGSARERSRRGGRIGHGSRGVISLRAL